MIVRPVAARVSQVEVPGVTSLPPRMIHLSESGGTQRLLVCHETLAPGAPGGSRHWWEDVDEVLYVLEGELTVIEDDGAHTLVPGEAAVWPAGVANAHAVENRSGAPCSYLRARTRPDQDVRHLPGEGIRVESAKGRLRVVSEATGKVTEHGKVD